MNLSFDGASGITEEQALVSTIVGLTDDGVNADVSGHAGEDEVLHLGEAEMEVQVSSVEGALARLVDDDLVRERGEFRNDLPTFLVASEDSALSALEGSGITNTGIVAAHARTPVLVGRKVHERAVMAFAGVDDVEVELTHLIERRLDVRDDLTGGVDIEGLVDLSNVAFRVEEVVLHVDDDEGGVAWMQNAVVGPWIRLGGLHVDFRVVTAKEGLVGDGLGEEVAEVERLEICVFETGQVAAVLDDGEHLVDDVVRSAAHVKQPVADLLLRPFLHVL